MAKTEIIEKIVGKVFEVEGPTKTIIIQEEVNMFSFWNLLILVFIILVVIKIIAPRVTLKNMIRGTWHIIIKPGKTTIRNIWSEIRDLQEKEKKSNE